MAKQYEKGGNPGEEFIFLDTVMVRASACSYAGYSPLRLPEALAGAGFRDAIRLASDALYRELKKKEFRPELLTAREKLSLLKYYNRMSFRPTPFGAFASFGTGSWQDRPIRLEEPGRLVLLPGQADKLQALAARDNNPDTVLTVNPALYRLGGQLRYFSSAAEGTGKLSFALEAVSADRLTMGLLAFCRKKPATRSLMAGYICLQAGCTVAEAGVFLDFLVSAQVLYPPGRGDVLETAAGPARLNDAGYSALERNVAEGGACPSDREELEKVLRVLLRLSAGYEPPALAGFIDAFKEKFNREKVPLLLALDPDAGVDYAGLQSGADTVGWLEGVNFPQAGGAPARTEWTTLHRLLVTLWGAGRKDAYAPLVISDDDLPPVEAGAPPAVLPPSIAMIYSKTAGAMLLESAGGATGTAIAGRFSVFSEKTEALCLEIAGMEARDNPGVVFADIAQRSGNHVDNISRRRPVYPYVIPVNVYPGLPADRLIEPADLLVSVEGREVILESRKLGKRVIPRLASAYNYHHTQLTVFRLLCDLQHQGIRSSLGIDPERYLPDLDFYPRIVYSRTILSLARWRISREAVSALTAAPLSLGRLHEFRIARGIPARVAMGYGDQRLVFDLAEDSQALFLLECLAQVKEAVWQEYLLPDGAATAAGLPVAAQIVAFCRNSRPVYRATGTGTGKARGAHRRDFLLGGEWLYLKFYCTSRTADRLLEKVIVPVIRRHRQLVGSWFFIRYADPAHHLRLRLLIAPGDSAALLTAFRALLDSYRHRGLVKELAGQTYRRELERYGPEQMAAMEEVFHLDSELAAGMLTRHRAQAYVYSFTVVAAMICCFFPDPDAQAAFLEELAGRFLHRFQAGKPVTVGLDKKYRELQPRITAVLTGGGIPGCNRALGRLVNRLDQIAAGAGIWPADRARVLLADTIHMHVNRLFPTNQVHHEAVIYYCLSNYYRSAAARNQS